MKHFPTIIAAAFAAILGASAHEYVWPHYTLLVGDEGRLENIETVSYSGALIKVRADAKNVYLRGVSLDGKFYPAGAAVDP